MVRVAINGFGRIGRNVLKIALSKGLDIVAINDLTDIKTLAHLIKYDSVYGNYSKEVNYGKDFIKIGGRKIQVFSEKDPERLPWKRLGIGVVIESTGRFRKRKDALKHIRAGAKKVIITSTSKDSDVMIVLGVNDNELKREHKIISLASCTTNCLSPVAKILHDNFKIIRGFMTTIHGYTTSQNLLDGPNKDLRRGRTAGLNIIPTTSGATTATSEVIPELKGKLNGLAMRVPIAVGSVVDFVVEVEKAVSVEEINFIFKKAARGKMGEILEYCEDEIVSSDIIGNSHSCIFDSLSTQIIDGNMIKVIAWYDNEFGYSSRVVDLVKRIYS